MRVDRIDLYSNNHEIARFDVNILDVRNPYIIKVITGLDADQIIPRFYGQGSISGSKFYDLALEPREIAMRIGLNPNYNVNVNPSDLRGDLYRAIASSRNGQIQLKLVNDEAVVGQIFGFVSKFEAMLFANEPEVQLTMRCDDPIFRAEYLTSAVLGDTDLIGTGGMRLNDRVSTSPHGFKFKLTFTGSVNPFTITNDITAIDWQFKINYPFISGDELYFSSEAGDKYLYRVRSSVTVELMDKIEPGSVWPIMFPGDNLFEIIGNLFTWNAIYWYETHWGV